MPKLPEKMDESKVGSHQRRTSAEYNLGPAPATSPFKCFAEVDMAESHGPRHVKGLKNRLKDISHVLTTSRELVKVLSRVWRLEHENSTSLSLVSALQSELDRACVHVNRLVEEQRENRGEVDLLLKQFEEEKVVWKIKEQDRIRSAITSMAGQMEKEKKLRRQTERLNKKLGREFAEVKASLTIARKELESERRAREVLEKVCEELAQGIGEDRAVVEEIRKQSAKVRREIEKEREMLQLADVLREERVQMKLSEAKHQFEEKNAVLDKLRDELEAYLKSKTVENRDEGSPRFDKIKELEEYLRKTLPESPLFQDNDQENRAEVNSEEDDSAESDLHSIELNGLDSSKSLDWSDDSKNRRNSIHNKSKTPSIYSETEWGFSDKKQEILDMFDKRGLLEFASEPRKTDVEQELKRYNMIRDLRDHIVSGSRIAASQDLASPAIKFGQQNVSSSKDPNGVVACHG